MTGLVRRRDSTVGIRITQENDMVSALCTFTLRRCFGEVWWASREGAKMRRGVRGGVDVFPRRLSASSSEAAVVQLSTYHFNEFLDLRYQSPTRDSIKNLAVYTRVRESCYNYGSPDYGMIPTLQSASWRQQHFNLWTSVAYKTTTSISTPFQWLFRGHRSGFSISVSLRRSERLPKPKS
jgi:hypothetical protein